MPTNIYLDNNVWNLLHCHGERVDIALEFPRPEYELYITRECEFEMNAIPASKAELKAFIHETINRADIQTDTLFGFSDTNLAIDENLPADLHRVGGPGVGRLAELVETQFMEAEYERLYGPPSARKLKPMKTKLYAQEADIALAARSFRSVILTLDDKVGPLSRARTQGGKVIWLKGFDPAKATLRKFVLTELANLLRHHKRPVTELTQMLIETVDMSKSLKCECGMSYIVGCAENERQHAIMHSEYTRGPIIPQIQQCPRIDLIGHIAVYVVDSSVPPEARRELARVAMIAQRSMPQYPAGYDGTTTDNDERLYVAADKLHVVGFVLAERDQRFWHLIWTATNDIDLVVRDPIARPGYKFSRIWVAADYRRRGLSRDLVRSAALHMQVEVAEAGWELPLTESGKALLKNLCQRGFWGCGDPYSVNESIQPRSSGRTENL